MRIHAAIIMLAVLATWACKRSESLSETQQEYRRGGDEGLLDLAKLNDYRKLFASAERVKALRMPALLWYRAPEADGGEDTDRYCVLSTDGIDDGSGKIKLALVAEPACGFRATMREAAILSPTVPTVGDTRDANELLTIPVAGTTLAGCPQEGLKNLADTSTFPAAAKERFSGLLDKFTQERKDGKSVGLSLSAGTGVAYLELTAGRFFLSVPEACPDYKEPAKNPWKDALAIAKAHYATNVMGTSLNLVERVGRVVGQKFTGNPFVIDATKNDDTARLELGTSVQTLLTKSLVGETLLAPTVHFGSDGKPRCFSYTIGVQPFDDAKFNFVVDKLTGYDFEGMPGKKAILPTEFHMETAGDPTRRKLQRIFHIRYLVFGFTNPWNGEEVMTLAPVDSHYVSNKVNEALKPEDLLSCAGVTAKCSIQRGKPAPSERSCSDFLNTDIPARLRVFDAAGN